MVRVVLVGIAKRGAPRQSVIAPNLAQRAARRLRIRGHLVLAQWSRTARPASSNWSSSRSGRFNTTCTWNRIFYPGSGLRASHEAGGFACARTLRPSAPVCGRAFDLFVPALASLSTAWEVGCGLTSAPRGIHARSGSLASMPPSKVVTTSSANSARTNVAEALDYAYRRGVVHHDIKPANILLPDGKPVIADFGIALAAVRAKRSARPRRASRWAHRTESTPNRRRATSTWGRDPRLGARSGSDRHTPVLVTPG